MVTKDTITILDTVCELDKGLVAYYAFTNGSFKDSSTFGNDIIFNNAVASADRLGNDNGAFSFDGSTTFMRIANSPSLNPDSGITIMSIVKVAGFYAGACHSSQIIGKGTPDDVKGFYDLRFRDAFVDCNDPVNFDEEFFYGSYGDNIPLNSNTRADADTSFIQTDKWYTVIYTYDGIESRLYVDGELKAIDIQSSEFTANANDIFIGRHEDDAIPYWFNGTIDELRIYNRAINYFEVKALSGD